MQPLAKAMLLFGLSLAIVVPSTLALTAPEADVPLVPFVQVDGVGKMQVPNDGVSWTVEAIDEGPYNHKLSVADSDGALFGALRFRADAAPAVALTHGAPVVVPPAVNVLDATPNQNCVNPTASHGWQVCAALNTNGAGNYFWMQGSATRNTGSCASCMTIIACSNSGFDCTNKNALFDVYATETYASACWSLPPSTWYASKVIYDGSQVWSDYQLTRSGSSTNC